MIVYTNYSGKPKGLFLYQITTGSNVDALGLFDGRLSSTWQTEPPIEINFEPNNLLHVG